MLNRELPGASFLRLEPGKGLYFHDDQKDIAHTAIHNEIQFARDWVWSSRHAIRTEKNARKAQRALEEACAKIGDDPQNNSADHFLNVVP